jgi:hypothetical protein
MSVTAPSANVMASLIGPQTQVTRRVDIYEEDGNTLWARDVPITGGSVSADQSRSERRNIDLVIDNSDGRFQHTPGGLWYDKVIKPYRGVTAANGEQWEAQLGEFLIDEVQSQHFPDTIHITGRDYTKKLLLSKLRYATTFQEGQLVTTVVQALALNGGITKYVMPVSGKMLGKDFTFEAGTERWKAITDICTAYSFEVFFDAQGYFIVREYEDPATTPAVWEFKTGTGGSLVSWQKTTRDARLYNVVLVTGTGTNQLPVTGLAENHHVDSPTRIEEIGERVYTYQSNFITTAAQAQEVADTFLKVHALEEYDLGLSSLVLPWLEVGEIIQFTSDESIPGEPDRFLLSNLSMPLALGAMSSTGKRVTLVGA